MKSELYPFIHYRTNIYLLPQLLNSELHVSLIYYYYSTEKTRPNPGRSKAWRVPRSLKKFNARK